MRFIVTLLLLCIAASATAAVYKFTKPDGTVIYSDRPPVENAAPTELPELQEIKITPPPTSSPEDNTDEQANQEQTASYTKLEITEPANDSAIVENSGQINIKLALEPPLQDQQGDIISILLDGKQIGQGKSTALTLSNVDRGKHTLRAVVKSAQGSTLITSPAVTFNLHRASALQRKPQGNPPTNP